MVNSDFMVARHLIPFIVQSYSYNQCSYEAMTGIRGLLRKRKIEDDFDMEVRDIDDTYSAIVFTFNDTKSIDDIVLSVIVVNHYRHTAHYYVLRHTVEYEVGNGFNFDFAVKNCLYGLSEIEMANEYARDDTFYIPNKETFLVTAIGYAKMEETCKGEMEDDEYAKKNEEGIRILEEHFAWGTFWEKLDETNELFD